MTGRGTDPGAVVPDGRSGPLRLIGLDGLRFSDDLEPRYVDHSFGYALPRTRFALVLAIVLYALFGVLDALIAQTDAAKIWLIRYAIVCPLGLFVFGLTFTRRFRSIMQPTLAGFAVVGGLSIVAMVAVTDASVGYLYYAGLLLVIPWMFTLLQLRFPWATGACLIIIAAYEAVAIWVEDTPIEILLNNNFFLLSAVVIGMIAGYTIESGTRTAFSQRRLIETQRAELADRNVRLDSALRASLDEVRRQAEELRASRVRIVVAADVERRRIERNLHDGAQQQLIALAVRLSVAESLAGPNEEQRRLLAQLKEETQEALENLRDLARGIYPPLLADHGLVSAVESQAKKASLPIHVEAVGVGRYPSEVEAAVYFSVLEALQNVAKYARATEAVVALADDGGTLGFEVRDDGIGFDPQTATHGIGLQGMLDRLQALGGSLEVRSRTGEGTTVIGTVPTGAAMAGTAERFAERERSTT